MLVSLIIVLIAVLLLLYVVQIAPLDGRITFALQLLIVLVAVIYLLRGLG